MPPVFCNSKAASRISGSGHNVKFENALGFGFLDRGVLWAEGSLFRDPELSPKIYQACRQKQKGTKPTMGWGCRRNGAIWCGAAVCQQQQQQQHVTHTGYSNTRTYLNVCTWTCVHTNTCAHKLMQIQDTCEKPNTWST